MIPTYASFQKFANANNLKNFRPVDLCKTSYKIVTKIIANRLKSHLPNLISPLQSNFIKKNRRASDNAIIIQELINNLHNFRSSKFNIMLKIDLEKAFNRLKWSFVYRTLRFFNFPPKISKLVMHCICASTIGVLVNGTKFNFFSLSRSLRQGDPMSPYIFILCMVLLSRLINHQVDIMLREPIKVNYKSPSFSHLFFVDDLILMGKASHKTGHCIKKCLELFCQESCHSINYSK